MEKVKANDTFDVQDTEEKIVKDLINLIEENEDEEIKIFFINKKRGKITNKISKQLLIEYIKNNLNILTHIELYKNKDELIELNERYYKFLINKNKENLNKNKEYKIKEVEENSDDTDDTEVEDLMIALQQKYLKILKVEKLRAKKEKN